MIQLENVSIATHGHVIVRDCNATIESASITRLTGANGSGKTTLIRAIAGIQRYSGSIRFDGADAARVRDNLYVCFDDAPVFPFLSGYENVRMLLGKSLSRSAISEAAPAIADHSILKQRARRLSQGQRRRVHLVAALLSGARYLILDEALNGVDAPTIEAVGAALSTHAPSATVLVTGHHDDAYASIASYSLRLANESLVTEVAA